MKCRHCRAEVSLRFVDLGSAPPSNAYLKPTDLDRPERWFPLRVMSCERCWLVQTQDFASASELFDGEYAYFSGFSRSWLLHAERYVARMAEMLALGPASHVVEVAANDGYLLQYVASRGIPCTGIEPTASPAVAARAKGLTIVEEFFGTALAERLRGPLPPADLMVANNVLAHVPDIVDFMRGFALMLAPNGVATFEFPHLMRLISGVQFDTIYHEHFSYLSLGAVARIAGSSGLEVFDVEELPTHGGSLRVFMQRADAVRRPRGDAVGRVLAAECKAGLERPETHLAFQARAEEARDGLVRYLLDARRSGRRVAAYGAAAKGNTLLNFAGIRPHLLSMVADSNPAKQGRYMPGSRIPIVAPEELDRFLPDDLVVLPWNILDEVKRNNAHLAARGTRFVTAIPELSIS